MKTYTQDEVIALFKKAARDIDKSINLGIFTSVDSSLDYWLKYNIIEPPITTAKRDPNTSISPETIIHEIEWKPTNETEG